MSKKIFFLFLIIFLISAAIGFADKAGTCRNPDGGNYCNTNSGISNCRCDSVCANYGDCCTDYKDVCGGNSKSVTAICPAYTCPYSPPISSECKWVVGKDANGCPTCGQIVCDKCASERQSCGGNIQNATKCCPGFHCENSIKISAGDMGGACVKDKINMIKCTDSDSGLNYYVKGFVSDQYTQNLPKGKLYDSCAVKNSQNNYDFINSCGGNNCFLSEYYCDGASHNTNIYQCPYGCKDGACVQWTQNKITKNDIINWIQNNCADKIPIGSSGGVGSG